MFETEQANTEMHQLCRQMISRIEKFGTVEGFADSDLNEVIRTTKDVLEPLSAHVDITAPCIVFGDIHGQLGDLLEFVKVVGRPPERQLLFLGDYVDRASKSLEVILWLFCMKILHPQKIHLLRGNHEVRRVNTVYGFRDEMLRKRNTYLWKQFNDAFTELPLCASINRKILCMHGGISPKIENWASLTELKKPRVHGDCELGLHVDLMWADPNQQSDECNVNMRRGISCLFGKTLVQQVCSVLDIDMIIRAHEVKRRGHQFEFDKRLLTIFSAPYYSGANENAGSVATISRSLKLQIVTLRPRKPHETMKLEREARENCLKAFQPLSGDPDKKVHCQSNVPSIPGIFSPFIGTFSMCAHETRHCKKENEEPTEPLKSFVPQEEVSALSIIRKTTAGYGLAISLKDEVMSLGVIRKKLGLTAEDDGSTQQQPPAVKTPTPEVIPTSPAAPEVPPPPPKTPPSSREN